MMLIPPCSHQHCSLSSIFKCLKYAATFWASYPPHSDPTALLLLADRLYRPQRYSEIIKEASFKQILFMPWRCNWFVSTVISLYIFFLLKEKEYGEGKKRRAKFDPRETFTKKRMHNKALESDSQGTFYLHYFVLFFLDLFTFILLFIHLRFFLSFINTDWSNADNSSRSLNRTRPRCWGLRSDRVFSSMFLWQPGRCHLCCVEMYPYFSYSFLSSLIVHACLF